jgi:hypothetical protein
MSFAREKRILELLNSTRRFRKTSYSFRKYQNGIIRNLLCSRYGMKNSAKPYQVPHDPQMEENRYTKLQFTPAFWTTHDRSRDLYR